MNAVAAGRQVSPWENLPAEPAERADCCPSQPAVSVLLPSGRLLLMCRHHATACWPGFPLGTFLADYGLSVPRGAGTRPVIPVEGTEMAMRHHLARHHIHLPYVPLRMLAYIDLLAVHQEDHGIHTCDHEHPGEGA